MIRIKRAYDPPSPGDGSRILVERLWPRGVTKTRAQLDLWLKEVAPSPELRKWFGHDPAKWEAFANRYRTELKPLKAPIALLRKKAAAGNVTLVYAARDEQHNSALVLKEFLERR